MPENRIREIENRLSDLEKEKSILLSELSKLRSSAILEKEAPLLGLPVLPSAPATTTEKIDLFLKLFRCRDDVYPKLWENKSKGTKGYSFNAMLLKMYRNRLKAYRKMGYIIQQAQREQQEQ